MANLATAFSRIKKGEQLIGTVDALTPKDARAANKLFGRGQLIDIHTDVRSENEQGTALKTVRARFKTKTPGVVKVVTAEKYGNDKKFRRSLPSWSVDTTETSI